MSAAAPVPPLSAAQRSTKGWGHEVSKSSDERAGMDKKRASIPEGSRRKQNEASFMQRVGRRHTVADEED